MLKLQNIAFHTLLLILFKSIILFISGKQIINTILSEKTVAIAAPFIKNLGINNISNIILPIAAKAKAFVAFFSL